MKRLLISYDLVQPGQDYDKLISYLENYTHAKPLYSVWVIKTSKSPKRVKNEIVDLIDQNDKVIVVDTTGKAAAWYPSGLDWLKNSQI